MPIKEYIAYEIILKEIKNKTLFWELYNVELKLTSSYTLDLDNIFLTEKN